MMIISFSDSYVVDEAADKAQPEELFAVKEFQPRPLMAMGLCLVLRGFIVSILNFLCTMIANDAKAFSCLTYATRVLEGSHYHILIIQLTSIILVLLRATESSQQVHFYYLQNSTDCQE